MLHDAPSQRLKNLISPPER